MYQGKWTVKKKIIKLIISIIFTSVTDVIKHMILQLDIIFKVIHFIFSVVNSGEALNLRIVSHLFQNFFCLLGDTLPVPLSLKIHTYLFSPLLFHADWGVQQCLHTNHQFTCWCLVPGVGCHPAACSVVFKSGSPTETSMSTPYSRKPSAGLWGCQTPWFFH